MLPDGTALQRPINLHGGLHPGEVRKVSEDLTPVLSPALSKSCDEPRTTYHRTFGKRRRFQRSPAGTRNFLLSRLAHKGSGTFFRSGGSTGPSAGAPPIPWLPASITASAKTCGAALAALLGREAPRFRVLSRATSGRCIGAGLSDGRIRRSCGAARSTVSGDGVGVGSTKRGANTADASSLILAAVDAVSAMNAPNTRLASSNAVPAPARV